MKLPDKEMLEQMKSLGSLARSAIVSMGVALFFVYCWSEHILPDGLSIGDALLLILIALGFGVVLVFGIVYGAVVAIWFIRLLSWFGKSRLGHYVGIKSVRSLHPSMMSLDALICSILCAFVFTVLAVGAYIHTSPDDLGLERTLWFFPACGLFLLIVFATTSEVQQPLTMKFKAALGAGLVFAFLLSFRPVLLNMTFMAFGLRSNPAALIVISADEHARLEGLAKQSGLHVDFCQLPDSPKWATLNARAIWHGIGTTSYLSLIDQGSSGNRTLTVPVPRSDVEIIHPSHVTLTCKGSLGSTPE